MWFLNIIAVSVLIMVKMNSFSFFHCTQQKYYYISIAINYHCKQLAPYQIFLRKPQKETPYEHQTSTAQAPYRSELFGAYVIVSSVSPFFQNTFLRTYGLSFSFFCVLFHKLLVTI